MSSQYKYKIYIYMCVYNKIPKDSLWLLKMNEFLRLFLFSYLYLLKNVHLPDLLMLVKKGRWIYLLSIYCKHKHERCNGIIRCLCTPFTIYTSESIHFHFVTFVVLSLAGVGVDQAIIWYSLICTIYLWISNLWNFVCI